MRSTVDFCCNPITSCSRRFYDIFKHLFVCYKRNKFIVTVACLKKDSENFWLYLLLIRVSTFLSFFFLSFQQAINTFIMLYLNAWMSDKIKKKKKPYTQTLNGFESRRFRKISRLYGVHNNHIINIISWRSVLGEEALW